MVSAQKQTIDQWNILDRPDINLWNKDTDLLGNGFENIRKGKGKLGQSERVAWTYIHYQT